ncbi:MAG: imelysin family protein [Devosia sp.]|jgi:predicted lipoprotein
MRLIAAAAFALIASPAFAASAIPFHDMIAGMIDGYARPKFAAFATATATLRDTVAGLCATPSAEALSTAQDAFRDTVLAYSEAEFLRMGPLQIGDREERLLFWPDNKGIALRQVQAALASKDPTAAAPNTLEGKSVAMQGLGAVEFLLFGTGADDLASGAGAYRCSYAAAASTLIAGIAGTINAEWVASGPGSAADSMLNPQPASSDYRTELEVINKMAATLTFGNDAIRDQRIAPILSLSTGVPKPRSALFWRSGMTGRALAANFTGLLDYFRAARFEPALGAANRWVARSIVFEFEGAIGAAGQVPPSTESAVTDPEGLQGLKQMYVSTGSLDTLDENLAVALGLSAGFSALDGD